MGEDELDLENRQLCPDGSCTGVIGDDGTCKECGKSATGSETEAVVPPDVPAPTDDDFEARELCSDGTCTGLIGPDGKCKECGKPS
jgi:hypothetical protein